MHLWEYREGDSRTIAVADTLEDAITAIATFYEFKHDDEMPTAENMRQMTTTAGLPFDLSFMDRWKEFPNKVVAFTGLVITTEVHRVVHNLKLPEN